MASKSTSRITNFIFSLRLDLCQTFGPRSVVSGAFCNVSCWRQASANSVPTSFIFSPFICWPLKVCSFDSISIKILEDKLSRPHIIWYLDILAKKTFPLCHLNIQWKIHNALHCLKRLIFWQAILDWKLIDTQLLPDSSVVVCQLYKHCQTAPIIWG